MTGTTGQLEIPGPEENRERSGEKHRATARLRAPFLKKPALAGWRQTRSTRAKGPHLDRGGWGRRDVMGEGSLCGLMQRNSAPRLGRRTASGNKKKKKKNREKRGTRVAHGPVKTRTPDEAILESSCSVAPNPTVPELEESSRPPPPGEVTPLSRARAGTATHPPLEVVLFHVAHVGRVLATGMDERGR